VNGKAEDPRQREQKVSKHQENLEFFIQQIIECLLREAVCSVLGINTRQDIVLVSFPLNYTNQEHLGGSVS